MSKNTLGFILLIALLLLTSILSVNIFFSERVARDKLNIHTLPMTIGKWRGEDIGITEREEKILGTKNTIFREYVKPSVEKISLFIVYSETDRSIFHPPEGCLMGSGACISSKTTEEIKYGQSSFMAKKIYLEKGTAKDLVLYCYKANNLYTHNYYLQQIHFSLNQLLGKRTFGALIRVSMPIVRNEDETLVELKKFMTEIVSEVDGLTG